MKMAKRMFSLANYYVRYVPRQKKEAVATLEKVYPILTGQLGILGMVKQDLSVLEDLIENHKNYSLETLKREVDRQINRLSHIYKVDPYLRHEKEILADIHGVLNASEKTIGGKIMELKDKLNSIMNKEAQKQMKEEGLI